MNYDEYFDLGTENDPLAFLEGMTTVSAARLLTETDGLGENFTAIGFSYLIYNTDKRSLTCTIRP